VIKGGPDTARFSWLLAALIVALALPPVLHSFGVEVASLRLGLVAVLVASIFVVSRRRSSLWLGIALAIPAIAMDWASLAVGSRELAMASSVVAILFLGLVIVATGESLMRTERVTTDTILGGICVYLLLGLLWVSAFTLLEIAQPGSLLVNGMALDQGGAEAHEAFRFTEILYFSFVTLTTVGYGDITPATSGARALASGEAIVGQLYVTIFVARLVGLHLAHSRQSAHDS